MEALIEILLYQFLLPVLIFLIGCCVYIEIFGYIYKRRADKLTNRIDYHGKIMQQETNAELEKDDPDFRKLRRIAKKFEANVDAEFNKYR
jgi:hypothetical protein